MRQRIKVAGAVVHEPRVMLLDEPFNGMDPRQRMHMMDVLRGLAAEGCVIVISSHILEELNELASNVLVMVSGRLAASGHFREIRKLMIDRPHTFTVRSSDNRALASALLTDESVFGIELADGLITVRTSDRGTLTRHMARKARDAHISIHEIRPTDESLESVFSYLVDR
jgi:ABC-2 type transport system ATP-binding protein